MIMKLHFDNQGIIDFKINHLSNMKNPNMNNLMSIDHAMRDWIDDADTLVPRMGSEFPRLSNAYKSKHTASKKIG